MHAGRLDGSGSAARVYRYLRERGDWVDAWELTMACQTTALSTRVSEIRHQLGPGEAVEARQVGRRWYYRIAGQLALGV